ncbi:MAG: LSU ribosomal protein L9p, partial [uncultured Solirubrobacteraceae bacterium]
APGDSAQGRRAPRRRRDGGRRLEGLPAQLPDPAQARPAGDARLHPGRPAATGRRRRRRPAGDRARPGDSRDAQQDGPHHRPPGRRRRSPVRIGDRPGSRRRHPRGSWRAHRQAQGEPRRADQDRRHPDGRSRSGRRRDRVGQDDDRRAEV